MSPSTFLSFFTSFSSFLFDVSLLYTFIFTHIHTEKNTHIRTHICRLIRDRQKKRHFMVHWYGDAPPVIIHFPSTLFRILQDLLHATLCHFFIQLLANWNWLSGTVYNRLVTPVFSVFFLCISAKRKKREEKKERRVFILGYCCAKKRSAYQLICYSITCRKMFNIFCSCSVCFL